MVHILYYLGQQVHYVYYRRRAGFPATESGISVRQRAETREKRGKYDREERDEIRGVRMRSERETPTTINAPLTFTISINQQRADIDASQWYSIR